MDTGRRVRPARRPQQAGDLGEAGPVIVVARPDPALGVPVRRVVDPGGVPRRERVRDALLDADAPESGTITAPPSSRSMYHRVSLYWQLSTASPVTMVNANGRLVRGPRATRRTARHMASTTCVDRNSCGRYADEYGNRE